MAKSDVVASARFPDKENRTFFGISLLMVPTIGFSMHASLSYKTVADCCLAFLKTCEHTKSAFISKSYKSKFEDTF